MHALIVVAHPRRTSFTHSLASEFIRGLASATHSHDLLDLYGERFEPALTPAELAGLRPEDVREHQSRVREAQGLVFIYPIWWSAPPAILQGWLQRVMTPGFAFRHDQGRRVSLLHHRAQMIINVGGGDHTLRAGYVGPFVRVLEYCGLAEIRDIVNWGIGPGMPAEVQRRALDAAFMAGKTFW